MKDLEWESWRESWSVAQGQLPDVRSRATREAARHRRANVSLVATMVGGAAANLWALLAGRADPVTVWGLNLWAAVVLAAVFWIQRGAALNDAAGPREALAFLERRIRIERQGAQLIRWAYLVGGLFVGIYFRDLFGDDWRVKLVARVILVATVALIFTTPWWIRRVTARQQEELDRWRTWMDAQQL